VEQGDYCELAKTGEKKVKAGLSVGIFRTPPREAPSSLPCLLTLLRTFETPKPTELKARLTKINSFSLDLCAGKRQTH